MKFIGAVIKEQNLKFAVVKVKTKLLQSEADREKALKKFDLVFEGLPVALIAENPGGAPRCFGRRDIALILSKVQLSQIPWKEYTYG